MAIEFTHTEGITFNLPQKLARKKWLKEVAKLNGNHIIGELTYIFCTDDELLEINRQYLEHDYYTDIISFDLDQDDGKLSGEFYISIDRVRDHAIEVDGKPGEGFERELTRVIAHGLLHLCGLDDKAEEAIPLMRKAEEEAINLWLTMAEIK